MLQIYKSPPGTGKSYHALKDGLAHIYENKGGHVIANFPITRSRPGSRAYKKEEKWHYIEWPDTAEPLLEMVFAFGTPGTKEGSILIICDEAQTHFNSRDWQIAGSVRKDWITFFSQSRHLGVDVILIAQDERMIDRQIRSLCEYTVSHAIMNRYGILKWFPLKIMVSVRRWSAGAFRGQMSIAFLWPWVARRYDHLGLFGKFARDRRPGVGGPALAGGPDPAPGLLETMEGFAGGRARYDIKGGGTIGLSKEHFRVVLGEWAGGAVSGSAE